jgi:hypothetical protein
MNPLTGKFPTLLVRPVYLLELPSPKAQLCSTLLIDAPRSLLCRFDLVGIIVGDRFGHSAGHSKSPDFFCHRSLAPITALNSTRRFSGALFA